VREIIGSSGLLADRSPEALATAWFSLLQSSDYAQRAHDAREHILSRYALEGIADRLQTRYADLLAEARKA